MSYNLKISKHLNTKVLFRSRFILSRIRNNTHSEKCYKNVPNYVQIKYIHNDV